MSDPFLETLQTLTAVKAERDALAARVKALEQALGPELQRLISLTDYHRKKGHDDTADELQVRAERLKHSLIKS